MMTDESERNLKSGAAIVTLPGATAAPAAFRFFSDAPATIKNNQHSSIGTGR
jgi:hypothetical protein